MLLRKLISDVEEENSRLANTKLSLEESCEQVITFYTLVSIKRQHILITYNVFLQLNSNITEKSNDMKKLREHIRKLDEQLDSNMQV